jgi:hypothetical protein
VLAPASETIGTGPPSADAPGSELEGSVPPPPGGRPFPWLAEQAATNVRQALSHARFTCALPERPIEPFERGGRATHGEPLP